MQESISGFQECGTWTDVVEHGERISRALRECDEDGVPFEEWEEWRPKSHERIDEDVNVKTAEQASISRGAGERAGRSPDDDLRSAGKRLSESFEELEADPQEAKEKWHDSVDYVARAADSAGRKMIRRVENTVYQKVTSQLAPYYFDNELISANIQERSRGEPGEEFLFDVNINDDELKERISEKLVAYEEDISRWHVDTEKDVESVAAAEGVEVTDDELHTTSAKPADERLSDPERPPDEELATHEDREDEEAEISASD